MNNEKFRNFVGAILLDSEKRIYLVKEVDLNKISEDRWNLPGGGVEDGETLNQAISREVEEETGYKTDSEKIIAMYYCTKEDEHWNYIVFYTKAILWNKNDSTDPAIQTGKWFTKDELDKLNESEIVHEDIRTLYTQIYNDEPISMRYSRKIDY
ncbi:MAG: NUDIX hydrolase [Candidatus Dojkabacteria bacterium]|nr:NUDIX hydrolase [Candidatus Dojkabacteria bacterium]MDQ7021784.1 NUDIX hydrolase [Candidatus Dojkabacteria bacterium]